MDNNIRKEYLDSDEFDVFITNNPDYTQEQLAFQVASYSIRSDPSAISLLEIFHIEPDILPNDSLEEIIRLGESNHPLVDKGMLERAKQFRAYN